MATPIPTSSSRTLTIGQLASAVDVGVQTLRYYERVGLLPKPPRSASGYRRYPSDAVVRVRFIRRAKELGFTLKEIRELFALRIDPEKSCADVRALTRVKILDIEAKMADLDRIRGALTDLAVACRGQGPTSECPILDAISEDDTTDEG
ncbi:MAG TPA: MerR family transcriptional regulator [Nannocystis exedens]|nr:MerR family transcriptional regulator [Nannocystis exedens]